MDKLDMIITEGINLLVEKKKKEAKSKKSKEEKHKENAKKWADEKEKRKQQRKAEFQSAKFKNKKSEAIQNDTAKSYLASQAAAVINDPDINLSRCWDYVKKDTDLHLSDKSGSRLTKWAKKQSKMPREVAKAILGYKNKI